MRKCPDDHVKLVTAERQGIEIDYCPTCRGVWLDRGELDKIIERSGGVMQPPEQRDASAPPNIPGRPLQISELFDF
jgi:Zn-finger nucleic acid-binding protein